VPERRARVSGGEPPVGERPADGYARRRVAHDRDRARHARRAELLSWLRVLVFLAAVALAGLGLAATGPGTVVFGVGFVLVLLLFTGVARAHRHARRRAAWHAALAAVCDEGLARLERRWADIPVPAAPAADPAHPYAADLGVVGRASLLHLLGPTGPATGTRTLAAWLLDAAPPDVVRARQEAAAELAPLVEFREELGARARLTGRSRASDLERFTRWAESAPWLAARPLLRVVRWLVPAAWAATAALAMLDVVEPGAFSAPLVIGIVGLALARGVPRHLARSAPGGDAFRLFGQQFALAVRPQLRAPELRRLQGALAGGGVPAALHVRRLQRALDAGELRYSPLAHAMLNVVVAWDLHVLAALDRWRRIAGRDVRGWFAALGELEALAACGTLAHDHPDWTLPELDACAPTLDAEGLGHPLLAPAACVRNDVAVGPPGTVLLVTGSNMAGKSTLLRAIGANAVLAQAGAPACARRLRLPPVQLLTSMRIADSLEGGLSFFMAELVRLKAVVDAARAHPAAGGAPRALFLLDEILQGTNSAERQVAARRVLEHLLATGAVGAVSTHDLGLADAPPLRDAAVHVHFRETLAGDPAAPAMTFDYRLRPGPATSANALQLVRLMGLD
jgi:hypothetical protein